MNLRIGFVSQLTLWLIICCVNPANGFGAYMKALRKRQNHTAQGTKNQNENLLVSNMFYDRLGMAQLKSIDEKFSKCKGIEIRELTIFQVQELFDDELLTSLELTNCYLSRIHQMNGILRPVLEINPNAINEAHKADMERMSGSEFRSLMHGIPVLLKDNIATREHMQTTAGSLALLGLRPKRDADIVKKLKKAGAVILGKSNLSEFSAARGAGKNGWSGRGGATKSAYNFYADPSGSSTGSAVGVSSNLAMVSVGTETDGSLIAPASVASIFTIKPTLGTTSTKGVVPISSHQDCVGPMARTVQDLAILLDALVPQKHKSQWSCGGGYMNCLFKKSLLIGLLRYPFWNTTVFNSRPLEYQIPHLEKLVQSMALSSHFSITDPVSYPANLLTQISCDKELTVLTHDFKHEINEYLKNDMEVNTNPKSHFKQLGMLRRIRSLKGIIQFNNDYPDGFAQDMLVLAEATDGIFNEKYLKARESNKLAASKLLDHVMQKYQLDALMFPTPLPVAAWDNPDYLDESLSDAPIFGYQIAAIAGYPSINVPAGIDSFGVPYGVTFIGKPNSEATLLQIGYLMEKMYPARTLPEFQVY